jgi:hypothetical protein
MKRLITFLFVAVIFASASNPLYAQDLTFTSGEVLNHTLSVCLDKKDALEIADAHKKFGKERANEIWMSRDKCGNVPVVGAVVGKVIRSHKTKEGQSSVVEILTDGKVIGYFLTTAPVNKPDRNT